MRDTHRMRNPYPRPDRHHESGVALISAILVLALMSALLVGFVAVVNSDQSTAGIGRDQTQAYAAAHAGLEKLTADLGKLFTTNYAPTGAQVNNLETTVDPGNGVPNLEGITFEKPNGTSGYDITYIDTNNDGKPDQEGTADGTDITTGPFAGLKGLITPYTVDVTARTGGGAEVRMRRTMQSVGIPVFQFGIFSETDLSFHSGENFFFGGRVHSNSNIFIAAGSGRTLTLGDRVTAYGDIIRTHFVNGTSASSYDGTVWMAKDANCTETTHANCDTLGANEGSLQGDVGSAVNNNWPTISGTKFNLWIRDRDTGAKRLDLPLVSDGAEAIDLIRRGKTTDSEAIADQRFYNLASLRITLADTSTELTGLPNNASPATPVSLEVAQFSYPSPNDHRLATSGTPDDTTNYRMVNGTSQLGGYILIQKQSTTAGDWVDVTNEILRLGVTGRRQYPSGCAWQHDDAVIRLQHLRDSAACGAPANSLDVVPNTLYDAREGAPRNETTGNNVYMGGVMHYVELDVANLKRWLEGEIGSNGTGAMNVTGYVVYFSDRRGNHNGTASTGEYGWENNINLDAAGTVNALLDPGEDINFSGTQELYGQFPRLTVPSTGTAAAAPYKSANPNRLLTPWDSNLRPNTLMSPAIAKINRAVFFRRALKLVNGGRGQLPFVGAQGLTVAAENPVYIQGNYNACGLPTATCTDESPNAFPDGTGTNVHKSAAVVADSVTLLSRAWNDYNSFVTPHTNSNRTAVRTYYRLGIIAGKTRPFIKTSGMSAQGNYGSDGGAHNFLRFLEYWGVNKVFYRGSMVSLFTSRQATGAWKCCGAAVYDPPDRQSVFETEFLQISLLPPRTPMFRDINTLTFRQVLRPTQQ
jgi:hypothetical protein